MAELKKVNVLTVCGAGVVSSTLIADKMKEDLRKHGYDVHAVETNPGGVRSSLAGGNFDFIANVSPLPGTYDIPVINAVGYFTGFDDETFIDEVLETLKKLGK